MTDLIGTRLKVTGVGESASREVTVRAVVPGDVYPYLLATMVVGDRVFLVPVTTDPTVHVLELAPGLELH